MPSNTMDSMRIYGSPEQPILRADSQLPREFIARHVPLDLLDEHGRTVEHRDFPRKSKRLTELFQPSDAVM